MPIGSRRLIYLPYLMGERTPHLNPNCRGVFFGLSAIHTKADMLRAVMEGVSYSLLDCFDILREMKINVKEMMACGGGGKSRSIRLKADCSVGDWVKVELPDGRFLGGQDNQGAGGTGPRRGHPRRCRRRHLSGCTDGMQGIH